MSIIGVTEKKILASIILLAKPLHPQQLQIHRGEQASLICCVVDSLLTVTFSNEEFCSLSAQGMQERSRKIIDNMTFVNFTTVKLRFLFLIK